MRTPSLERLIQLLVKLPGIGERTAERLAFHLLLHRDLARDLAESLQDVAEKIRHCQECYNFAEEKLCSICSNPRRNRKVLCVVEEPKDVLALEQTGNYNGLYHVLLGRFSPMEKSGSQSLTVPKLVERVKTGEIQEVILATNPTLEGDGTALYVAEQLREMPVTLTRIGRGVPWGMSLSYANKTSLADALSSRTQWRGDASS